MRPEPAQNHSRPNVHGKWAPVVVSSFTRDLRHTSRTDNFADVKPGADVPKLRVPEDLCRHCGLCCNGGIFGGVRLQPGDDAVRLKALGLKLRDGRFRQPCSAWEGCQCRIYGERPVYCRQFECGVLRGLKAGRLAPRAALRLVRRTLARLQDIDRLLMALGERDVTASIHLRFRRIARRLATEAASPQARENFGELTLALHEFQSLLAEEFYPGRGS
jgi:hypothetical protein